MKIGISSTLYFVATLEYSFTSTLLIFIISSYSFTNLYIKDTPNEEILIMLPTYTLTYWSFAIGNLLGKYKWWRERIKWNKKSKTIKYN